MDMSERKGFRKGVEALRAELIEQFSKPGIAAGNFDGLEIAHLIRGVQVSPKDKPEEKSDAVSNG